MGLPSKGSNPEWVCGRLEVYTGKQSQRIILLSLFSLALLSTVAYGQGTASILGTVTDATGSAVPAAKITITNTENGFVRNTVSNATGSYAARELTIGRYSVKVEAPGFKTYEQNGITLHVNDH